MTDEGSWATERVFIHQVYELVAFISLHLWGFVNSLGDSDNVGRLVHRIFWLFPFTFCFRCYVNSLFQGTFLPAKTTHFDVANVVFVLLYVSNFVCITSRT